MSTTVCEKPPCLTASAVLEEFHQVMEDWNHRAWQAGEVSYPTPVDATVVLLTSPYGKP